MKLGGKIGVVVSVAVVGSVCIAYYIMVTFMREEAIHFTRNTMHAAVIQAETVRDNISSLGKNKAFDKPLLLKELEGGRDYRQTTLYQTIPVVAAWQTIQKMANEEGFKFRVPKHNPRNPDNKPTEQEAAILETLERGNMEEYFKVDKKRNVLVYARPIRLTPDCLLCHGDPATSPTGDGKDILGMQMENWKVGELHGAFILEADMGKVMSQVNDKVSEAIGHTALILCPFILILASGVWYFNRNMVVKPLTSAIRHIEEASTHAATASEEISSSSQALAEGASEQAASIEETSASLEEMTSMTRTNLDEAKHATELANEASAAAERGKKEIEKMFHTVTSVQETTRQLSGAMDGITASSNSISTVIKTIDEIAFQTNILALNAAVEAARAGEAGMGFAVVADEVRALAQRSADAAKETAQLIDDSVRKSKAGVVVSNQVADDLKGIHVQAQSVNAVLQQIVAQNERVNAAIAQIASACREQNQGVEQISIAVSQMDKVTQSNAATAEESASAAAELHEQANNLSQSIIHLVELIGNAQDDDFIRSSAALPPAPERKSYLSEGAPKKLRVRQKPNDDFQLPPPSGS